jgi:Co/Zn/Cd efflux system component
MTYLFNYGAERMKHKLEYGSNDDDNSPNGNDEDKRELQRLLLELIPPSISASTLTIVTIMTMKQSIKIILSDTSKENPPDITIMLIFSALNLALDAMNVIEFSRVDHVVLSMTNVHHQHSHHFHRSHREMVEESITEVTELLKGSQIGNDNDDISKCSSEADLNLNMCSAWTHIAADTLRSISVLVAASFSALFPQYLSPMHADSLGAILVSLVILISLLPLFQGMVNTAMEIRHLLRQRTA